MDRASHDAERATEAAEVRAPLEAPEPASLAHAAGNRAFGAFVARMGQGILPGGAVHPDVATAIAGARGSGHAVPDDVRDRVAPHVGDDLGDVRLHTDPAADALARSVAARAFTTGTDVFFAAGEYQPSTTDGGALLAHELTHVAQQRGATTSGPMTVSEPGEPLEVEAEAVARDAGG